MSRASRTRRAMRWNGSKWLARAIATSSSPSIHVFAADPLAAHQPRKPAPARQGVASRLRALVRRAQRPASGAHEVVPPPMFTPYRLRGMSLHNRIVVSRWRCIRPGMRARRFHMVHLARAPWRRRARIGEMTAFRRMRAYAGLPWPVDDEQARPGNASSISSMRRPRPNSGCSSAMPAARARPRSPGRAPTSRWRRQLAADLGSLCPNLQNSQVPREMTREDMGA